MPECTACQKDNSLSMIQCAGCGQPLPVDDEPLDHGHQEREEQARQAHGRQMVVGAIVLLLGFIFTAHSYAGASPAKGFTVAIGAIVVGAIQLLRGWAGR